MAIHTKKTSLLVLILLSVLSIHSGCGQKGPLYIQEAKPVKQKTDQKTQTNPESES